MTNEFDETVVDETAVDTDMEDSQILQETVFNQRIVNHRKLGAVRLRMPTLGIQKKIERSVRKHKKQLLAAKDEVEGKLVPAYRSKEALRREYIESGWWSEEKEERREEVQQEQIALVAELEVLGFESEEKIIRELMDVRKKLLDYFDEEEHEELRDHITMIVNPGYETTPEDRRKILDAATSTDVDELLDDLLVAQRMYKLYYELIKLSSEATELEIEYTNLFADSWQEQLQYFTRLAQVYYCTERVVDDSPIWPTMDDIENEQDTDTVRWLFSELNDFWQGVSDEVREKRSKYDFFAPVTEELQSSDESPEEEPSKSDGQSVETEPISSTEVTDTMELSPRTTSISVTGSNSTDGSPEN
jgi:hypothetical protein